MPGEVAGIRCCVHGHLPAPEQCEAVDDSRWFGWSMRHAAARGDPARAGSWTAAPGPGRDVAVLATHGVPAGIIGDDSRRMDEVRVGATANPSVVGVMSEFTPRSRRRATAHYRLSNVRSIGERFRNANLVITLAEGTWLPACARLRCCSWRVPQRRGRGGARRSRRSCGINSSPSIP